MAMFHCTSSRFAVHHAALAAIHVLETRLLLVTWANLDDDGYFDVGSYDDEAGHEYRIELVPGDATRVRVLIDGGLAGEAPVAALEGFDLWLGPGDDRVEFGDGMRWPIDILDEGGDDTIIGGDGDEVLGGGPGDDLVIGNGGNDSLWGATGNDILRGGAGNDHLAGGGWYALPDDPDADLVDGGPGDDRLDGNHGDDTLVGDQGRDTARGGTGRDKLIGVAESFSVINGRIWEITADQDPDHPDDRITIDADPKKKGVVRAIVNGKVLDRVKASRIRSIYVHAGQGDDVVRIDVPKSLPPIWMNVWGGDGDDQLYGGHTDDLFSGEKGNDTVDGGDAGDDDLTGDAGEDVVTPFDADYTYSDRPAGGRYYADTRLWDLYLHVTPDSNGNGQTVLIRVAPDDPSLLQLVADEQVLSTAPSDEVQGIFVTGSPFGDHITLKLPDDFDGQVDVEGLDGDDTIIGGRGDQLLVGGYGDDVIVGGADADKLVGAAGDDVLRGGSGSDVVSGGKGDDTLLGGKGDDELAGGGGDDRLDGQAGTDALRGGAGADTVAGGEPIAGDGAAGEAAESKKAKRRASNELLDVRDPLARS